MGTGRWRRAAGVSAVVAGLAAAVLTGVARLGPGDGSIAGPSVAAPAGPMCLASPPSGRLRLDLIQAEDAATIAAVARREGLPDFAVTVAFTAALQESKLRNPASGDLDSVGVFQQRPSQGWGAPEQLQVPSVAAAGFFGALVRVPNWQAMTVAEAAQAVQHSAGGDAYQQWEHQATILTDALTGHTPAAFACRFPESASAPVAGPDPLPAAMAAELGPVDLAGPMAEDAGWAVASWLVAHAAAYHVSSVAFMGRVWTPTSGDWKPQSPGSAYIQVGRS
jgi:hypothetical protein